MVVQLIFGLNPASAFNWKALYTLSLSSKWLEMLVYFCITHSVTQRTGNLWWTICVKKWSQTPNLIYSGFWQYCKALVHEHSVYGHKNHLTKQLKYSLSTYAFKEWTRFLCYFAINTVPSTTVIGWPCSWPLYMSRYKLQPTRAYGVDANLNIVYFV